MTTTQTAGHLDAVLADLATVIAGVRDDQLALPTPCTDMDVAELRRHIVGWLTNFADGYADPNGQCPRPGLDGFVTAPDSAVTVRAAAATLRVAIDAGAAERPLMIGESGMPGDMALSMILWEYLVHGWDLATATGQRWSPPEAAAAEALVFAPSMLSDEYRGEGQSFGLVVPVPDGAPALSRLLGFSGRDPAWMPARFGRRASGAFDLDAFDNEAINDTGGTAIGRARIVKTFRGDLEGTSSVEMLHAGVTDGTSRVYVAIERVDGVLHGRKGSFVLRHDGWEIGGERTLSVRVLPRSGTGELAGLLGELQIDIDADGAHHYRFDYKIADGE